jgi:Tfp pilus assembly major pilin PilA
MGDVMGRKGVLGFSLLELLIAGTVIVVTGAVAYSSYQNFLRRTYYSEIISVVKPYQEAVAVCGKRLGKFAECNAGKHAIPADITKTTKGLNSLTVVNGVITVVPETARGITGEDSYILTPKLSDKKDEVVWSASGNAVVKKYVQ